MGDLQHCGCPVCTCGADCSCAGGVPGCDACGEFKAKVRADYEKLKNEMDEKKHF